MATDSFSAREVPGIINLARAAELGQPVPSHLPIKDLTDTLRLLTWQARNEITVRKVDRLRKHALAVPVSDGLTQLVQAADEYLAKADEPQPSQAELVRQCIARIQDPGCSKHRWRNEQGRCVATPDWACLSPGAWKRMTRSCMLF